MEQENAKYKAESLELCKKLILELENNKEDAMAFSGGTICKTYLRATEVALNETKQLQSKLKGI